MFLGSLLEDSSTSPKKLNFAFKKYAQAISYKKLILKTENGGLSPFAGVFDPGSGRNRPALLKVRPAILRDAIQQRLPLLQERGLDFSRCTAFSSKSVSYASL